MNDMSATEDSAARRWVPFAVATLLALGSLFVTESGFAPLFVILAFLVGYLPADKMKLSFEGIEDARRSGRETLHRLSDAEIDLILATVRKGHKLQAIKELRSIKNDGLKEAKKAIDLLDEFGLKWRDSINKPPR